MLCSCHTPAVDAWQVQALPLRGCGGLVIVCVVCAAVRVQAVYQHVHKHHKSEVGLRRGHHQGRCVPRGVAVEIRAVTRRSMPARRAAYPPPPLVTCVTDIGVLSRGPWRTRALQLSSLPVARWPGRSTSTRRKRRSWRWQTEYGASSSWRTRPRPPSMARHSSSTRYGSTVGRVLTRQPRRQPQWPGFPLGEAVRGPIKVENYSPRFPMC